MKTVWVLISPVRWFMNSALTYNGAAKVLPRSLHSSIVYLGSSSSGSVNESCMVSARSSIGEISSKISSRPLRLGRSVRPWATPSAVRSTQKSLPTSQSKLSVCNASRSGTVNVSVILANERREADRPFLVDFLLDAVRAAAKGNNLRGPRRVMVLVVNSPQKDPPRRYTRGAPAVHNMTA